MTIEQLDEIAKFGWALAFAIAPFALMVFVAALAAVMVIGMYVASSLDIGPPSIMPPPIDKREPH